MADGAHRLGQAVEIVKPFIVASKGTIAHSVYGDAQGSLEKVGIFAPHHVAIRIVAKVALPIGQLSFAHQDMVVVVGLEEGRGVPAEMQRGGFFCARIKGFVSKNYKIGRCLDVFVDFFITLRSDQC